MATPFTLAHQTLGVITAPGHPELHLRTIIWCDVPRFVWVMKAEQGRYRRNGAGYSPRIVWPDMDYLPAARMSSSFTYDEAVAWAEANPPPADWQATAEKLGVRLA